MTIKLIAFDLDGTALNSGNQLTEATKVAFIRADSAGLEMVPVSGRCFHALPAELL